MNDMLIVPRSKTRLLGLKKGIETSGKIQRDICSLLRGNSMILSEFLMYKRQKCLKV